MSKELANSSPMDTNNDLDKTLATLHQTMDNLTRIAATDAVYGKPIKSGDVTIIPTAEVLCGMGFGVGSGDYTPPDEVQLSAEQPGAEGEPSHPPVSGSGSGGGGGGYSFSRPVALVIVSPEGVRVEPILDRTKILLAALTTAGFMIGMMARMVRQPRL
jgi:uncharacterized spore protein YtfJ